MLTFSYIISPALKKEIERIEELRQKILSQLLPRSEELELRFEATVDRAIIASKLTDTKLTKANIIEGFTAKKNTSEYSAQVKSSFNAYMWLDQKWFLNREKVKFMDVKKLYSFFPQRMPIDERQMNDMLSFIQVNPEHPIVQAGLGAILSSGIIPSGAHNLRYALLTGEIFLYKYGFDFRGLLSVEEFISSDQEHFKDIIFESFKSRNLSQGLEYYTQAVGIQAEHALKKIMNSERRGDLPSSFFELTERQKEILTLFAKPGVKITNKTIQKQFKISQITASRDLSKLHTLGLIFSGGKGRSIYYTRI